MLILVSFIWSDIQPIEPKKIINDSKQGFYINDSLPQNFQRELAWGSNMILTATPAVTVLIYLKDKVILHRGIMGKGDFIPGPISESAINNKKHISLVNTKMFPGRIEFDSVYPNLPSILVVPFNDSGVIVIGGISERSFSKGDEKWIIGYSQKLSEEID